MFHYIPLAYTASLAQIADGVMYRCYLLLALLGEAAKPLCRDLSSGSDWQDCRVLIGGLAIQGAEAFNAALGPTFQDYLTNTYNDTYGTLAGPWVTLLVPWRWDRLDSRVNVPIFIARRRQ